ncbi:MAG TPA: hypothetical protein VFE13_03445 [Caulobacteraceae bacterium]|jgi:hypothetical protein|nr:hypothetical protein [Caulobacteraceae bacterium]
MRTTILCLAGALLLAACSRAPTVANSVAAPAAPAVQPAAQTAPAAAPAFSSPGVTGAFTANGKPATLIQVTAHKDEPFDGKPVTALVFTSKDQAGDDQAATKALFGDYGDAIVARVQPDGTLVGSDVLHSGLKEKGSVSISGPFKIENFSAAGGQISGRLTSNGPTDVFDQKVDVDLTFHVKAP